MVPDRFDEILEWLNAQRGAMKARMADEQMRAAVFKRMLSACMEKGAPLDEHEMEELL